jgi:hypothetical protein
MAHLDKFNGKNLYGADNFNKDLVNLQKLIANYKSGGKSGNRFYTITKVDGKVIESDEGGRYTVKPGQSPGDAAKRAFTQRCRINGSKKDKIVTLRETTQGSAKKEYSYSCKSIKLKKPRKGPIDKKTGKPIMFEYESHCTKIKTSSSKGGKVSSHHTLKKSDRIIHRSMGGGNRYLKGGNFQILRKSITTLVLQSGDYVYKLFKKDDEFLIEHGLYSMMSNIPVKKSIRLIPDFEEIDLSFFSNTEIDESEYSKVLKLKKCEVVERGSITKEDKDKLKQKLDILESKGIYLLDLHTGNLIKDDGELLFIDLEYSLYPNCILGNGVMELLSRIGIYCHSGSTYNDIIVNPINIKLLKAEHVRQLKNQVK